MRPLAAVALSALLAGVLAAGCVQSKDPHAAVADAQRAVDAAAAKVLALDHDEAGGHADAALHQGGVNLDLVGYSNGVDDTGDANHIPLNATYNEFALHGHYAFLSRTSTDGSDGGFSVVDVQDPTHPHVVGGFRAQGGDDVEVTDDGTMAFLSTQRNTPQQVTGAAVQTQDPTTALPRGIYAVDIRDPAHPTLDSFLPLPVNGPHTMTYFHHPNGSEYLIVCTYDLVTDPVTGAIASAAPATQRVLVYLIAQNPAAGTVPGPRVSLLPVAQYQKVPPLNGARLVFPHDTSVQVHPLRGANDDVLLTVAYWDLGVRILDFTHPPTPTMDLSQLPTLPEVGSFTDFSPSAFDNIHFAKAFPDLLMGPNGTPMQVTVAEPEIISADHETGQVTFIDTTDPSHLEKVSSWTLPPQDPPLGVTDLDFSPHNFDTFDGKVALAHYHAGVWVVDVGSPQSLAHPAEVAFYMTAKPRDHTPAGLIPDTWGVKAKDGLLYASDISTGLYILRYTGP